MTRLFLQPAARIITGNAGNKAFLSVILIEYHLLLMVIAHTYFLWLLELSKPARSDLEDRLDESSLDISPIYVPTLRTTFGRG